MKREPIYWVKAQTSLLEFLLENVSGLSRNSVKHLLSRRQVLVDGAPQSRFDFPLRPGQQVTLLPQARGPALPFPVLYEDEELIALNKPAGLLSVGTETEKQRTAYRILSDYLRSRAQPSPLFIVHRLDRDTSGVLLFSKSRETKDLLQDRWNTLVQKRAYWAVVEGSDLPRQGVCRSLLRENSIHRVYSTSHREGKEAVTRYTVLRSGKGCSLLDVELDTGRKNQIRVHLSELGYPVAGDKKYGAQTDPMRRLALHAHTLSLIHPKTGKPLTLSAPAPKEFQALFPGAF